MDRITVNRNPVLFRIFRKTKDGLLRPLWRDWHNISYDAGKWYTAKCVVEEFSLYPHATKYGTSHEAPDEGCSCGFWAYFNTKAIYSHAKSIQRDNLVLAISPFLVVPASVEVSGRMVIGDWGVRAEKMKILKVYDDFGVAMRAFKKLEELWKRFAISIDAYSGRPFDDRGSGVHGTSFHNVTITTSAFNQVGLSCHTWIHDDKEKKDE
jgi:hypothetical protein